MAENPSIALAAVLVAGVVGVAAPIITWQATRDTGELSARATLVRGDREDLRRVLDRAASTLDRATSESYRLRNRWVAAVVPLRDAPLRSFSRRIDEVEFSTDQLAIRVGQKSNLYGDYRDALLQLQRLGIHVRERPVRGLVKLEEKNALQLIGDQQRFRETAHALAGSQIK